LSSCASSLSREGRVERNRVNVVVLVVVSSLGVSRARNIPAATYVTRGGVAIFVFVTKNRALFVVKTFFFTCRCCVDFSKIRVGSDSGFI
jgi:hypothetical protein